LIALGSVVGMALTSFLDIGPRAQTVLATAGSFAAIAALFGGPVVAGVLLVEAGLAAGAALIPMLLPGFVAAAVGYLIFVGVGDWGGVDQATLTVPGLPMYEGTHLGDLAVALAVGVLTAVLIAGVRRLAAAVADLEGRRLGMGLLLIGGGLMVGALALLADGLGADYDDVLFSGQASVPDVVAEGSFGVVLVIAAAKALAYAVSLGCGFRGGPVFPAILLGVAIATLAVIALDVSPTLAVAAGAAAGMTAATRLVISSLVLTTLLVGTAGVDALPAAVLATVAAWTTMAGLDRHAQPEPSPPVASAT
jgi:H+/Cl- antiporter ClcA